MKRFYIYNTNNLMVFISSISYNSSKEARDNGNKFMLVMQMAGNTTWNKLVVD